ncbi:helix-turn-helix transcriptional regulator [Streptomyces sp. NBC_00090]|uniref:helix-turn-helix transcriptional regulator n=1 Tax=Streptomyces sp. NBC_00090 TaxID=2903619 RepID=UPI003252864A
MPPVFAHGRLRLYLLKLLDEAPRHGYEVIRLLEERFQGLYAPSAGTVYPRLAKLEAEGLVTHASEGGRKVYSITDAGRAELAGRGAELTDLEQEIRDSVSELAAEIRDDVRGAAGRVRSEMRAAAGRTRQAEASSFADAKEELRRAKQEWKEQARQAKAEAQSARHQAKEFQRIAQQVQEEVQDRFARGDWPKGVWEGISDITAQLGGLVAGTTHPKAAAKDTPFATAPASGATEATEATEATDAADAADAVGSVDEAETPEWARETEGSGDPGRDLDRLLDRFRDEIRDAARDHGVSQEQLTETRRHLSTAAIRITGLLRPQRKS